MKIESIPISKITSVRPQIITFIRRYGEGRITHKAIRWFRNLTEDQDHEGNLILIALEQRRLMGITLFGEYGIRESLIVVHPKYRKRGVGEKMVQYAQERFPKIYARVAIDNIPSLKLCFACGLVAFDIHKGPTGKPTLWLGYGDWHRQETEK